MASAWTIGRLFDIPVRLHWSMVLVPLMTYGLVPQGGLLGLLAWLCLVVLLFGSVLLHELGHALTGRRFGVRTMDIVLTPLGGMARIIDLPATPRHEIAIALAGPAVSLTVAGALFGAVLVVPLSHDGLFHEVAVWLIYINAMLGLFNLIPALPMDGGRVLRGLIALRRDHLTATRIAARIGRVLAVAGIVLAFYESSLSLGLISFFIFTAAGSEVRLAEWREYQRQAQRQGLNDFFPFAGPGRRVWTWHWSSGRGPAPDAAPMPPAAEGWTAPGAPRERDVLVVEGKAEVLPRREPKDEGD